MTTKAKPKTKKGKNAVTKVEKNEVVAYDYGEDAGVGVDDIDRSEMAIPFIGILQSNSPEIQPIKKGGLEGAELGMLINTVTKEVVDGDVGIPFVACFKTHEYIEWVPRDSGGGFVAVHAVGSEVVAEAIATAQKENADFGKFTTKAGNDLVETYSLYGVLLDEDGEPNSVAVIAFTSTKIKKYKQLNTKLKSIKGRPPIYSLSLIIKTVDEKNKKGDFVNFDIVFAVENNGLKSKLSPTSEAFQAAKTLRESIIAGEARADHAATTNSAAGDDADDAGF